MLKGMKSETGKAIIGILITTVVTGLIFAFYPFSKAKELHGAVQPIQIGKTAIKLMELIKSVTWGATFSFILVGLYSFTPSKGAVPHQAPAPH